MSLFVQPSVSLKTKVIHNDIKQKILKFDKLEQENMCIFGTNNRFLKYLIDKKESLSNWSID